MPDTNDEIQWAMVWCRLDEVYKGFVNFEPHCRLPLDEEAKIMKGSSDSISRHIDIVHLKVSQGTAIEEFIQQIAACLMETAEHEDLKSPVQVESALTTDATNACAFISVEIADILLGECTLVGKFFAVLASH